MSRRVATVTGWSLLAVALALTVAGTALIVTAPEPPSETASPFTTYVAPLPVAGFGVALLTYSAVGALVLVRRPRNRIGWLFAIDGVLMAAMAFAAVYAHVSLTADPGSLPAGEIAAWMTDILYLPLLGTLTVFLFLLFPDGRLRTRSERRAAFLASAGVGLGVLAVLAEPHLYAYPDVDNPLGITGLTAVYGALGALGGLLLLGSLVASIVLLIGRLRRARGRERDQLRILVVAAVLSTLLVVPVFFVSEPSGPTLVVTGVGILVVPTSVGVAILRHRLFDIDLVIRRTVVFGLLAAFIALVYVGVVVAIPVVILGRGSEGFDLLPFAAAAVIALAFQPVRARARRLAARLVYGDRATPYEVLSGLASRMAGTYEGTDLPPRIARGVAEGTNADRTDVWLRLGDELRTRASWPPDAPARNPVAIDGDELPRLPAQHAVPVRHRGELLGALTLDKPAQEPISSTEERLLADVASQAGLALRNVRLTEELRGLVDELRASRQRLVKAQDEERRKLERDIHDGAQQQLVALAVKVRMADAMMERDLARAHELMAAVQADAESTLEELRNLARGIFPPLLADEGLSTALEAQARKAPVPVEIRADGVGRYAREVEASVYFCCLEALQNAAKYAEANAVEITLSVAEGELRFEVSDDGKGFDPETTPRGTGLQNIADRLEAIGGSSEVRSSPGLGTRLLGRIPVREEAGR